MEELSHIMDIANVCNDPKDKANAAAICIDVIDKLLVNKRLDSLEEIVSDSNKRVVDLEKDVFVNISQFNKTISALEYDSFLNLREINKKYETILKVMEDRITTLESKLQ